MLQPCANLVIWNQCERRPQLGAVRNTSERGAQRHEQRRTFAIGALADLAGRLLEFEAAAAEHFQRKSEELLASITNGVGRGAFELAEVAEHHIGPELRIRRMLDVVADRQREQRALSGAMSTSRRLGAQDTVVRRSWRRRLRTSVNTICGGPIAGWPRGARHA